MKKILLLTYLVPFLGMSQFFTQDFEGAVGGNGLPAGWTETGLSTDGIYTVGDAAAASSTYLAYPAHTNFAYSNDDACNCDKSADRLILPAQNFSSYSIVQLSFSYYLNGGYSETGSVEVSTDNGMSWTSVLALTANATVWNDAQIVDLSSYNTFTNVLIAFRYNDQFNWGFSLGIDDVELHDTDLLSNDDFTNNVITLYPNPTSDKLFLNTNSSIKLIKVINMLGQEVLSIKDELFDGSIDVSNLQKGTYFLHVETELRNSVTKFIKN
jgi:hypothetical protein